MAVYFVSRHPGAVEWARAEGIAVDELVPHLAVEKIKPGDVVIGSLPIHLAADVCSRGGRYLHLSMEIPHELRGMELDVEQMRRCRARIEEFEVRRQDTAG